MNLTSEPITDPESLPPAHFRKKRNFLPSLDQDERSRFIAQLARRVEPTFDFFLFALLSGAVLAAGWLFHAPALLVVGSLLAPFMAPVVGLALSTAVGSLRFFMVSFAGLLVGIFMVFITGIIAGLASPIFAEYALDAAYQPGQVPWDMVAAYLVGMVLTSLSLIKSEQTPSLPSAILSYVLLTRASAAGYELGRGHLASALWQVEVAGFFILAGLVIGLLIFWAFAFRPNSFLAYAQAVVWIAALAAAGYWVAYPGVLKSANESFAVNLKPIATATAPVSHTPLPSQTVMDTPEPGVTFTVTATLTPVPPSLTPTLTYTPTVYATALQENFVWAFVAADEGGGARLRDKPSFNGQVIRILDNKLIVRSNPVMEYHDKVWWVEVQTIDGTIGWMVHTVLITATPLPSATHTPKP
jgi:hypothetical protein